MACEISPIYTILVAMDEAAKEDDKRPDIPPRHGKLAFLMARHDVETTMWLHMDHMRGHWRELAVMKTIEERLNFSESLKKK